MKKRIFFIGMLAAGLVFTACSSDDSIIENASKSEACTFKLTLPSRMAMDTRAVEDRTTDGNAIDVDYNDVTCYLNYSASRLRYNWADDPTATPTNKFMIFKELTAVPLNVTVVTNAIDFINTVETPIADGQNIAESTNFLKNITAASQNMMTINPTTDTDANSLENVTLVGNADVTTTTTATEFESNITLGALVARFEIGNPTPGLGLESLTVDAVYVNNFYRTSDLADTTNPSNWFFYDNGDWSDAMYADTGDFAWAKVMGDMSISGEGSATTCYAWQLFANIDPNGGQIMGGATAVPHFIFKVSGVLTPNYALSDGNAGTTIGNVTGNFSDYYVTVSGLKVMNDETQSMEEIGYITRQNIYQIGNFVVTPEKIGPPEPPRLDLTVTCTVAPWGLITATPVIQ